MTSQVNFVSLSLLFVYPVSLDTDSLSLPLVTLVILTSLFFLSVSFSLLHTKHILLLLQQKYNVIGYRVFLRSNSEEWKSHETLAEGKANSHTIHGLKCGSKYQVYILAFNEVGNSDPSESLAFSTEGGGKWSFLVRRLHLLFHEFAQVLLFCKLILPFVSFRLSCISRYSFVIHQWNSEMREKEETLTHKDWYTHT